MEQLTDKKCAPCEGIGRAYTSGEVQSRLGEIPGWLIAPDGKAIERTFVLRNFTECVELINKIKNAAEAENHHPDLHLTGYKNLRVVLNTHTLGGITENDMILAAKINQLV